MGNGYAYYLFGSEAPRPTPELPLRALVAVARAGDWHARAVAEVELLLLGPGGLGALAVAGLVRADQLPVAEPSVIVLAPGGSKSWLKCEVQGEATITSNGIT